MKLNAVFFYLLTSLIIIGCAKSDNDEVQSDDGIEVFDFTITSMTPEQGKAGDTISITGSNFSNVTSENTINFDGVTANIITATSTTLEFIVPQLPHGISTVSLILQGVSKTIGAFSVSIDDYKYIAVANNRRVYTIGNNSGETIETGSIEQSGNRSVNSKTLINTETKIFGITRFYLGNTLELLVYDKVSGLTNEVALDVPSTLEGPYKAITTLMWNEQNSLLTGLLNTNEYNAEPEYHVININPVTYEVTDTGIITPPSGNAIFSIFIDNNKIYYTSNAINSDYERDLVKVDLDANTTSLYYFNNYSSGTWRMSKAIGNNKILAFRAIDGTNNVIPIKIDLTQNTLIELVPNDGYSFVFLDGRSFYDPNTNLNLNIIGDNSIGYSIYKFNESSQEIMDLDLSTGNYFNLFVIGIME